MVQRADHRIVRQFLGDRQYGGGGAGLFDNVGAPGRVNLENGMAFVYCALDLERAIKGAV